MRAIAIEEFGGRDRLTEMDLPAPRVGPDSILVRIRAAGVNPVDYKLREGGLAEAFPHVFPVVPGWDVAGVVEQVGPAVTGFEPGDEVLAYCRKHFVGEGTYAEYVAIPEGFAAPRPDSLGMVEAAAVPLAGLTAWQALVEAVALRQDEAVLIHAAAGGVGSFAVQIAASVGARAVGTAREEKHGYLRDLGAADVIDYTKDDFVSASREMAADGFDVVFDTVGGDTLRRSVDALREGGRLVSIAEPPSPELLGERAIDGRYVFVRPDGEGLAELGRMLDDGRLRVPIEETFPLERAADAHERLEAGRVRGKLALTID
ncbi:MAG: NADP-dependent oxidoreductase [Thermoleophilaceae bacterium]|jgi:NADPH:quinone reductase-like Zn-dependent oxidoreductase|nr:NADP-dependent oxidoreductase [Thermoleophilaceae bacterium]